MFVKTFTSDKCCVQWGITANTNMGTSITVTLPKAYANTNYSIKYSGTMVSTDDSWFASDCGTITTTSFNIVNRRYSGSGTDTLYYRWCTIGYIS